MNFKRKILLDKQNKKRLLSNFFSLSVLQIFSYILPIISIPYLVRVLGADVFGLLMFAQSFVMFFSVIVDFGFDLSATKDVSVNRENNEKITEIFSSVMIIKLFLVLFSFLIFSCLVFFFDKLSQHWEVYFITFIWVLGQALFPVWYFQGIERMRYITIVSIFTKLFFTCAIFLLVRSEADYLLVPVCNGLGFLVGGLYSLKIIRKDLGQRFELQSINTLKYYFKDSFQFFLARLSVTLYSSANSFVLGVFTNNTMVGYYSVAEKMYHALYGLYSPLVRALYPYIAKGKNIKLFKKIFYLSICCNIFAVVVLFFFADSIFSLLFTQKVGGESFQVFNIFLIVIVFVVPSVLLGYPLLGALGFSVYANKSVMYGSCIHVIGLVVLSFFSLVTIYNVAFLVLFTESIVLMLRVFWVKRNNIL